MTVRVKVSIIAGLTLCSISDGFIFGQMSGMIDALRGSNNDMTMNDEDVSWIASTINATCLIGFIITGAISERFGRRLAITIVSLPILAMWITVFYAKSLWVFLISRIIVGVSYGGLFALTYISVGEYTTPSQRAVCVNLVSAVGPSIGTSLGHVLCILLHWRYVALIGLIPTGLSAILPFTWVESPSWLASKGRFYECEKSFRALHGQTEESESELKLLVNLEKIKQNGFDSNKHFIYLLKEKLMAASKEKYFWRINILAIVVIIYRVAGGRILFSTMAITMLQEITGSSNILLFTFLVDGFIIVGSILPCYLLKVMKTRTLLFSFGFVANFTLIILAISLYYIPKNNIYYPWICSSILAFYFIIVFAGPYAVLELVIAECYPLEFKFFMTVVIGGFAGFSTFMSVKIAPSMSVSMGYHGIFLLNSAIVFGCLGYLWFNMPETKGKTMQEIELIFRKSKLPNNFIFNTEQANFLSRIDIQQ